MTSSAAYELSEVSLDLPVRVRSNYNFKNWALAPIFGRKVNVQKIRAIDSLSLTIKKGERLALIGSNGAGKTTLLRLLSGALLPTWGTCRRFVKSTSLIGDAGYAIESELSGRENLLNLLMLHNKSLKEARKVLEEASDLTGLGSTLELPTYSYSTGMLVRLRVVSLLFAESESFLMDEAIGGADLSFNLRIQPKIDSLLAKPRTLVIASHDMALLSRWCNSALILQSGKVLRIGEFAEIANVYRESAAEINEGCN